MKKAKGRYIGITAVKPYGSYRHIIIENGYRYVFFVHWERAEEELKGIKKGDLVSMEYIDEKQFKIRKM